MRISLLAILNFKRLSIFISFLTVLSLASCVSNKKIPYFKDIPDTTQSFLVREAEFKQPLIRPDDILSISIQTVDPQTSAVLNQISPPVALSVAGGQTSSVPQTVTGFLVGKDSLVELPIIGKVKICGLSTSQAKDVIRQRVSVYFKDASVSVRFANYKITVLGEVSRPGIYTMPNEKVSLLDALGAAGDLTIYGKRENIMVIRETADGKRVGRLNLNSADSFKSPYFHLKQNDVVYVEPTKAKVASLNAARTQAYALAGTIITLLIVIVTRFNF